MNQPVTWSRPLIYCLIAFTVVLVIPLIALATYNHPSPTDDYCFTDTVLHYGFWQAQQFYYDGWTGRYFHNFIVHTNPLVVGWFEGYKIYPVVFLAILFASFYALSSQWLHRTFGTLVKMGVGNGFIYWFYDDAGQPARISILVYRLGELRFVECVVSSPAGYVDCSPATRFQATDWVLAS